MPGLGRRHIDDGLASFQPHPDLERRSFLALAGGPPQTSVSCPEGPLMLFRVRLWTSEERMDGVTDVFFDDTALSGYDRREIGECLIEPPLGALRTECHSECRGAPEVNEEGRNDAPLDHRLSCELLYSLRGLFTERTCSAGPLMLAARERGSSSVGPIIDDRSPPPVRRQYDIRSKISSPWNHLAASAKGWELCCSTGRTIAGLLKDGIVDRSESTRRSGWIAAKPVRLKSRLNPAALEFSALFMDRTPVEADRTTVGCGAMHPRDGGDRAAADATRGEAGQQVSRVGMRWPPLQRATLPHCAEAGRGSAAGPRRRVEGSAVSRAERPRRRK